MKQLISKFSITCQVSTNKIVPKILNIYVIHSYVDNFFSFIFPLLRTPKVTLIEWNRQWFQFLEIFFIRLFIASLINRNFFNQFILYSKKIQISTSNFNNKIYIIKNFSKRMITNIEFQYRRYLIYILEEFVTFYEEPFELL